MRRLPWGDLVLRFVVGGVGVWVAYVVLINLILASGLAKRLINGISPHVVVTWSSASSDWFARFHVRDFAIRGDDAGAQWRITIDDGTTSLDPYELFQKKVHLHEVRGRGVTVRVRRKLEPRDATPAHVAKLPPIEGLPDPPLKPAVKPKPGGGHVVLEMTNIVAEDVREVWVDEVHVDDESARAEGSFLFDSGRKVRVRATVHARSGGVLVGKARVVSRTHGDFGLVIRDLDPRDRGASAHFDVEAHATATMDSEWLAPMLARHRIFVREAHGPIEAWVEIARGVLQPKSRADARAEGWTFRDAEHAVSGSTLAHAVVRDGLVVSTESYGVDLRHRDAKVAHAPRVSATIAWPKRDLGQRLGDWSVALDVPTARFDDMRALDGYLGNRFFRSGAARASVHATISRRHASGSAKVVCDDVSFELGHALVSGEGTATATLRDLDLRTGSGSFSLARVELHDVTVGDERGWWARVSAAPLSISASRERAATKLTAEMRDARAVLAVLGAPRLAGWIVGDGRVTASSELRTMGGTFSFDDVRAIGKHLEVHGHVAKAPKRGPDGSFLAALPFVNIRFDVEDGKVSSHPFATKPK